MSPQKKGALRLTDDELTGLRCPEGRKDVLIFDGTLPGFGVRVTADGKRVFIFQYRVGGTVRRHRLGAWGKEFTATKARRQAEILRGHVHAGRDPVAERRATQALALAETQLAREQAAVEAFTFGALVSGWETKGLAHRRESYRKDATARLRAYFVKWLDRPAAAITKAEAIQALDRIERERGTISARRALAYGRAAYGWAGKRDMINGNPFQGVAGPGKENPRDRVLTDDEIGAIWQATAALDATPRAFVRVLLLTLQRRGEVAGMRWDELAPDWSTWTIPAERAKNGKRHLVHLPQAVQETLRTVPRQKSVPLVFVSRTKGEIGGSGYLKTTLLRAMQADGKNVSAKPTPHPVSWRFHDFRRTGVTTLANQGVPPHVADKLLNHVTGAIQGVAAVYQRAEFLAERKQASETWARHVLACAETM